ncbi:mitochondrial biogenesis protein AIM24 [Chloropicon roscoffensis]|uniref:Mitochondrial biogenesis protein AIM24 n=1 Tax=Chloropicon roscoffensis TaxID=1461544 RepID=A0AAX4PIG5_9CHLO
MSRTEAMGVTPFAPFVYHASRDDGVGLEFHIVGGEAQILQVLLPPNRSIEAEPGALFYMSGKVKAETKGAGGGIVSAMSRLFSGESFFVNSYVNEGDRPEYVAFATQMINRILPLDLAALGNEIYCQPDSYFCSVGDVRVTSQMTRSLSAGLFGGEGLLLQRIQGTGLCWITAGGTPVQKQLAPGETVLVDAGCLVAFQPTVRYELKYAGSLKSAIWGGEGIFLQRLTGPGLVILESLPRERLAQKLVAQGSGGTRRNRQNTVGGFIAIVAVLITIGCFVAALLQVDLRALDEGLRHVEL